MHCNVRVNDGLLICELPKHFGAKKLLWMHHCASNASVNLYFWESWTKMESNNLKNYLITWHFRDMLTSRISWLKKNRKLKWCEQYWLKLPNPSGISSPLWGGDMDISQNWLAQINNLFSCVCYLYRHAHCQNIQQK